VFAGAEFDDIAKRNKEEKPTSPKSTRPSVQPQRVFMFRLAVVCSHPIQYYTPLFRALAAYPEIDLTVYYCDRHGLDAGFDKGFGREFKWDIELLGGYRAVFLSNQSWRPGIERFWGLLNFSLFKELSRHKHDAIMLTGYSYATQWLAFAAAKTRGMKVLIRFESHVTDRRSWLVRAAKRLIVGAFCSRSDACLYIGEKNRRYCEYYGATPERLFFSPYSVDGHFFQGTAEEKSRRRASFRRNYGIPENLPLILFAAKLIPVKQPLHLLEAFEKVRRSIDCGLVFVGDGELRSKIEARTLARQTPNVYLAGFLNQTEMPSAYMAADLLVMCSVSESWGLVVNEAMHYGLPAIVTDRVGCAGDLVRDGENGYIVAWNDAEALAEAIKKIIGDAERRRRFGERSLEIVEEYSLARTAAGIVEACRSLKSERTINSLN
jgi:glycosyltransferase involved in cell wall biosynthesis